MALDFPSSPTVGQTYNGYIYDGTKWKASPTSVAPSVVSATPPTNPTVGDMWFNSTDGTMYFYYNDGNTSQWVESRAPIVANGYYSPNYVINGAFDIWQRGTSFSNLNNGYSADRWLTSFSGSGSTRSITQQVFAPGTSPEMQTNYYINLSQTVAGTGATWNEFATLIEDVRTLSGKTATFSFWAKSGSSSYFTGIFLGQTFGISTRNDIPIAPPGVNIQLTSTWTKYSYTFNVPSIAGKSIASNASYLFVAFQLPLNNTHNIDIANVQLEEGSAATTFRRNGSSQQGELAACQRYYINAGYDYTTLTLFSSADSWLGSNAAYLPTEMRTAPSITVADTAGNTGQAHRQFTGSGGGVNTAVNIQYVTPKSFRIGSSVAGATDRAGMYYFTWKASAEL